MKNAFIALATFLLVFTSEGQHQLCKHHSGVVHVFAGAGACDGEHDHGKAPQPHHESNSHSHEDHDHGSPHSQHGETGEHHEPCEHETFSDSDDKAPTASQGYKAESSLVAILQAHEFTTGRGVNPSPSFERRRPVRGPPGTDDSWRLFASCIRLIL